MLLNYRLWTPIAVMVLFTAVTGPVQAIEPQAPERLLSLSDALAIHTQKTLANGAATSDQLTEKQLAAFKKFYQGRNFRPIWVTEDGFKSAAGQVMDEIRKADDWGLDVNKFSLPSLQKSSGKFAAPDLVRAELELSLAVLTYAHHARGGRVDPTQLSRFLERGSPVIDAAEILAGIATSDDQAAFLRAQHPSHPQFVALRKVYLALKRNNDKVNEVKLPSGPTLRVGDTHAQVAVLRERLSVASPAENNTTFDEALVTAVKSFQKSYGLTVDGIVGNGTRGALNGANSNRLERVLVNMERWRWLPNSLGEFYVWANIPEFRVRVIKNGTPIFSERLVAGKYRNQTPIFSDEMERIVFHPYWNVPNSIKVNEILPGLRRSTSIMAKQNLKIKYKGKPISPSSVDWNTVDVRKFHFYQPPGGGNVLGFVKFMFPNKHAVYMHDTPSKSLFNKDVRTYSHGCMRIRNPRRFAEILLNEDKGWGPGKISSLIASKVNTSVELKRKIPVHVTYFTAAVNDDGKLILRKDHYGHDRRVALALAGKVHLVKDVPKSIAKPPPVTQVAGSGNPNWLLNVFGLN